MGGDTIRERAIRVDTLFQSTPPHGGRLTVPADDEVLTYVSIHAPAWGATNMLGHRFRRVTVSIHAPAWGATESEYQPAMES